MLTVHARFRIVSPRPTWQTSRRSASFERVRSSRRSLPIKIVSSPCQSVKNSTHRSSDLVWQVAPRLCAGIAIELSKLKDKTNLEPAFKDSIFTTSEVVTCAGLNFSRRNYEAAFYALEVLTICGTYNFKERGHLIFWEDDAIIPLRPGTTVAFPGGTKRYLFVDVAHNEKRYIFRQFCHAGILRWVEKGFRSDVEFEATASHAEMAAWNARRAARGEKSIKLYGKLKDIIVF
ncbi:hypothetical protein B0H11DRAFT_1726692 [Mycena galericulata]|nr:hypothetical protein B0H11DRAFT_1726692 [Mycena galericulata]